MLRLWLISQAQLTLRSLTAKGTGKQQAEEILQEQNYHPTSHRSRRSGTIARGTQSWEGTAGESDQGPQA